MMGMIATHFTREGAALGLGFSFQFRKPVHAGETVRLEWQITEIEPKPSLGGDVITLAGRIIGNGARVAVRATATVLVLPQTASPSPPGRGPG
jgi:acyl dehydratase